ncbi:hypothetical protein KKD19_03425 [Patescibacteria group bacterium]|nr:hypothetical protein [Patescibacteria group bacterium]
MFGQQLNDRLETQDSTFFDYAHSHNLNDRDHSYMILAITNQETLNSLDIKADIKPNGYITINAPIPREAIHIIRIQSSHQEKDSNPRKKAQKSEQTLFKALKKVLEENFEPGSKQVIEI